MSISIFDIMTGMPPGVKARELEDVSPDEYAERKGVEIVEENPSRFYHPGPRRKAMTKAQLEERIAELEEENEDLRNRLDSIVDIVQPEVGDNGDDDEDEDDDCDDEDGYRYGRAA